MNSQLLRRGSLLLLVALILCGSLSARNYVVVLTTGYSRGSIYDMDAEGNLTFREYYWPCNANPQIKVSCDSRLIVESENRLNLLFFNSNGTVAHYYSALTHIGSRIKVDMDPVDPKFYAVRSPFLTSYRYNPETATITTQTQSRRLGMPKELAYSSHARMLYYYEQLPNQDHWNAIQGYSLGVDDQFDTVTTLTAVGRHSLDFATSHDGQMLASTSIASPQVKTFRITTDGALHPVQDFTLYPSSGIQVFFSPDDRWMYLVRDSLGVNHPVADSYFVDPVTKHATLYATITDGPWTSPADDVDWLNPACSITPDGKYLIVPHWRASEQRSYIGLVRLNGGEMELMPIQQIAVRDFFTASGVAMFNTNATAPGWAQYE